MSHESLLREGIAKAAEAAKDSPIFRGKTDEEIKARFAQAVRRAELKNPDSTKIN